MFIKEGKTNIKYLLIVVILATIVGGGILWLRTKQEIPFSQLPEIKKPETLPLSYTIKNLGLKKQNTENYDVSPTGDWYYYWINQDTKIIFRKTETDDRWSGDVILDKDSREILLFKDAWLIGPGGEVFSVYSTNFPNIFLITAAAGDMGWWFGNEYYLNLNSEEIIFTVEDDQGNELRINKKGIPRLTISLEIDDKCGKWEEREGKKAQIIDLILNDKPTNMIKTPIEVDCIDPGGIGSIYDPSFDIVKTGIESDFSKMYFSFEGEKWKNGESQEVWRKDFYIDLSHPENINIQPAELKNNLINIKNDLINIEVLDNSIRFNQILTTYCNTDKDDPKLECKKEGNNLKINEIFDSIFANKKLFCSFEITGEIFNLEKGSYKITFVFEDRHIFEDKYIKDQRVLGTFEFEIK